MGQRLHKHNIHAVIGGIAVFGALLLLSVDQAAAQTIDISDPEIAALNQQAQFPAVFFPRKPSFRVNGQIGYLVGLSESHVLYLTTSNRPRTLENSAVQSVTPADGRFEYRPNSETLSNFMIRVGNEVPNFTETYGAYYNDSSYAASTGTASAMAAGGSGFTRSGRNPVPLPVYSSGEPWEQTVLLNPPKVKPKPRPRPTPPPQVEPEPASTGFPTWAKYGIAAMGIAAIFVMVKK